MPQLITPSYSRTNLTKSSSLVRHINSHAYMYYTGDFNYRKINWLTMLNKDSNSSLVDSDGQSLIDIMSEASAEQLVLFPTRERNTLDLLITILPGQFTDIKSPDSLSDHDIVMGTLKCKAPRKTRPTRAYYQYSKGNYNQMREDTHNFTKDKYFNGHHHTRTVEENWKMIKNFIMETTEKNIPSLKYIKRKTIITMDKQPY